MNLASAKKSSIDKHAQDQVTSTGSTAPTSPEDQKPTVGTTKICNDSNFASNTEMSNYFAQEKKNAPKN